MSDDNNEASVLGSPVDLGRIADALEGAGDEMRHRNAHLTEMGQAITALVISTEALVIAVKGSTERNRQFRWLLGLGVVLTLTGLVAAIVLGVRISRIATQSHMIATENHATNQLIVSCVTPAGECAKHADDRTAIALVTLERTMLEEDAAAAACARDPKNGTYRAILACARQTLGP